MAMASTASVSSIATLFTSLFTPSKSANPTPPLSLSVATTSPAKPPPLQAVSLFFNHNSIDKQTLLYHQNHPASCQTASIPDDDVLSVVCPSLACANTLFFKSAYNVQVIVEENEPEEKLLNRFRREVIKAGVIQECKRRRFFENKQAQKKRKTREAAKRNRRRRFTPRPMEKQEIPKSKKEDEDKDNWELPDKDLPY